MPAGLGTRIALDIATLSLLTFCLSYGWLGNTSHELAGSAVFGLVAWHNVVHRRWLRQVAAFGVATRGPFDMALTLALAAFMLVCLGTSLPLSEFLLPFSSLVAGTDLRLVHAMAGYWLLVLVGIHLGLRWPTISAFARGALRMREPHRALRSVLRIAAHAMALLGVYSCFQLQLGTRLTMEITMDWWNFDESVAGFFLHCLAIVFLFAHVGHAWRSVRDRHAGTARTRR